MATALRPWACNTRSKRTGRTAGAFAAVVVALCLPNQARAEQARFLEWPALLPGLTQAYKPSSENVCTAGKKRCVRAVIREMQRRFRPMASACDHKAIFALSYLRTTQEYWRAISDPHYFEDNSFVNREDAVFARYYFDAFDDWEAGRRDEVPPAWAIAMQAADDGTVPASGDLSLGISAHVQRDLPFVLADIGLVKPDGTSRKRDHDKVNDILERVTAPLISEIARRFDPTIDDGERPAVGDDDPSFQIIVAWREKAWRNAERLATAPNKRARQVVAAQIEDEAATQAKLISLGTAYPPGQDSAARDAYCAARGR